MYRDLHAAGLRVFGLHGFTGTTCACGFEDCKDAGKHPLISNWQNVPVWSNEQFETLIDLGHFDSGYGVVCRGLLVVDIDPRNGGDMTFLDRYDCGFIVETGGGGLHGYFTVSPDVALVTHLDAYPGIDFKSAGYVVGPGSRHVKGVYKVRSGSVDKISPAPAELLAVIKRDDFRRADVDGHCVEYTLDDLADMLSYIPHDLPYEDYLRVGMALHSAGAPFELWDNWARQSPKYTGAKILRRWNSFTAGAVGIGTLIYHAEAGGWSEPVTFTPSVVYEIPAPSLTDLVDLLRPPGFVGEVAAWIEANNRRPREHLSVAAALYAVGAVAGLKYTDDKDGVTTNLFICCVAGARTGKERPQECIAEILRAAGLARARAGEIKSEQEIIRNLGREQACYLIIDELGFVLQKLKNAQKSGNAAYLEGILKVLMSAQGKANTSLGISGDMKETLISEFSKRLAAEHTKKQENERFSQTTIDNLQALIKDLITTGSLSRPFLALIGFTTPETFEDLVTHSMATNGFFGRSLIVAEPDNAPRSKPDFHPVPIPTSISMRTAGLYCHTDTNERIQYNGERIKIPSTPEALVLLRQITVDLEDAAIGAEDGLAALYLGAYENVTRISLILAAEGGLRTAEHVQWAYAYTKRDIERKRALVQSNDDFDKGSALVNRLRYLLELSGDDGMTAGYIYNRMRQYKRQDIDAALEFIQAKSIEYKPLRGPVTYRYYL